MTTKIPVELSSTPGIVDGSNATAITIDSSENVTLSGDLTIAKTTSGADSTFKVASTAASGENDATVIINSGGTGDAMLRFDYESSTDRARIGVTTSGQALQFFTAGNNERMRITSAGKVGIGTTSPARTFHINSADANVASFEGHQGEGLVFNTGTDGRFDIIGYDDGASSYNTIHIRASSGNGLQLTTSGTYLFGTTTSKAAGDNPADENSTVIGPGYLYLQRDDSTEINQIVFGKDGQIAGRIVTTTATSLVSASDYRMKENVDYTWDATTRLKQLKPARYNWIADETNTLEDGFLAHEVSSVVPNAVFGEKDAVDSDGNPEMQGVDQSKLVPLLVKTIQELEARITTLEG